MGLFIVLFWVFAAILADFIVLFDALEQSGLYRRKPPGTMNTAQGIPYIFGTDTLGRDLFSRMIYGSQIVLLIAPAASLVAMPPDAISLPTEPAIASISGVIARTMESF